MLIFNGGGVLWGYCGGQWGCVDGMGGEKLTNVMLLDRLKPYTKVQL